MLVLAGRRPTIELEQIPRVFTPVTGAWGIKCEYATRMRGSPSPCSPMDPPGLFNIFVDDASYNSGHARAYQAYGIDPKRGALVIVRPDHCEFPPRRRRGSQAT